MCKRTKTRLDKFTHRLRHGDYGYCCHRLRKATRRKEDAVTAAGQALEVLTNGLIDLDSDRPLLEQVLNFKDDLLAREATTYTALASLACKYHLYEQASNLIRTAPRDELLGLVKVAATDGNGELAEFATRLYVNSVREDGLAEALGKVKNLTTLFREIGCGSALDSAKEYLANRVADDLAADAFDDFLAIFKGETPSAVALADNCEVRCEFGNQRFNSVAEFRVWLDGLIEDRGPLEIERTDAFEIHKDESYIPDAATWLQTSAAVVRDPNREDALFVVLMGNDLADGTVKKIWLSTNNRIWNCPFEAPLYKEKTVTVSRNFTVDAKAAAEAGEQCRAGNHPNDPTRPTRANELASKILEWATTPSEKCFRQAIWAIAVDAIFGKTVFVPANLTKYGAVRARGPVGPDGRRFYVAFVDCPNDGSLYTELKLSDFLSTALGDDKTIGVGFKMTDGSKLLVRKETLEELAAKVGPDLTSGEEDGDAKAKD